MKSITFAAALAAFGLAGAVAPAAFGQDEVAGIDLLPPRDPVAPASELESPNLGYRL